MNRYEYIKWYWQYIDDDTPVLLFYEVDLQEERYATRMVEIFSDRSVRQVIEEGFEFITEAPLPEIEEINKEAEFFAEIISKEEFESAYNSKIYSGDIDFPQNKKGS